MIMIDHDKRYLTVMSISNIEIDVSNIKLKTIFSWNIYMKYNIREEIVSNTNFCDNFLVYHRYHDNYHDCFVTITIITIIIIIAIIVIFFLSSFLMISITITICIFLFLQKFSLLKNEWILLLFCKLFLSHYISFPIFLFFIKKLLIVTARALHLSCLVLFHYYFSLLY